MIVILPYNRRAAWFVELERMVTALGDTTILRGALEYALKRAVVGPLPDYVDTEEWLYETLELAVSDLLVDPELSEIDRSLREKVDALIGECVDKINVLIGTVSVEWRSYVLDFRRFSVCDYRVDKIDHDGVYVNIDGGED